MTNVTKSADPPRLARTLLQHALPEDVREEVAGDMVELFRRRVERDGARRARLWYRGQALSFTARFAMERVRGRKWRGGRGVTPIGISWLDWKLGVRMLAKYPGLSLIGGVALTGAIAIGTGLFHFAREELYPELPLDEGERIVRIESWDAATSSPEYRSLHDFPTWREQVTSIEQLGAYRTVERNLIGPDGAARPVQVAEISASAFPLTRVPPLLGRPLTQADEQPGAADVVVIGYDVWKTTFDGDSDIIGRIVELGRWTATVVGVMPEDFGFPRNHRLWVPLRVTQTTPREGPPVQVFGRLAAGATFETAQAELAAIGNRAAAASPETHEHLRPRVTAYVGPSPGDRTSPQMLQIYIVVMLIMIVACANVATLVFARTAMRESEIVVRNALGANRGRIIGQLLVEALVLASVAAVAGLALANAFFKFLSDWVVSAQQAPLPFWRNSTIELSIVLYTALLAVVGAALIGLIPAIKATGPRVQARLKSMAGGDPNVQFGGMWSVVIIVQVALTVLCLPVGIGFSYEAIRDYRVRSAFASDRFLTFRPELDREVTLGVTGVLAEDEFRASITPVYEELERRLMETPGVSEVTFASRLPSMSHPRRAIQAQRANEPPVRVNANLEGTVSISSVALDFFDAFDVPLVAGRAFDAGDIGATNRVVIVNESFARNLGGSPLGVRVRDAAPNEHGEPGVWHEIVGVVQNLDMEPTDRGEADFMFHPASPADAYPPSVAVRVNGDPAAFTPELRAIALDVDPGLRLYELLTLDEVVRRRDLPMILGTLAVTGVVLIAMLLSAMGLFALMAVAVARRTREIGIRLALGASRRGVLSAVFGRAATQLGGGILIGNLLIGLLAGVFGGGLSQDLLVLLVGVSGIMVLVGLLACVVPARRALRIEPTEALRQG